jgi:hypothetical protein
MKTKILVIIITIIMLAFTASAYVPPELRTGEQMSEYEVIKTTLTAYDAGGRDRWVMDNLEDAAIHHTNSGRSVNNYQQLREWLQKVENQKSGKITPVVTNPENLAIKYANTGNGFCSGYDAKCQRKVN